MSASRLREAAALMRERAEATSCSAWVAQGGMVVNDPGPLAKYVADCFDEPGGSEADANHIASWHPAVALAVADWLVLVADGEHTGGINLRPGGEGWCALAVADAYLGGTR